MTTKTLGDGVPRGGHWLRLVRDWEGLQVFWYCGRKCAEDPVYGLGGAQPAPGVPGAWPLFCDRCGLPVGNPLSPDGLRRARELAEEVGGWQADALRERYGLAVRRRRRCAARPQLEDERRAA